VVKKIAQMVSELSHCSRWQAAGHQQTQQGATAHLTEAGFHD